jgi:hypothetical protein
MKRILWWAIAKLDRKVHYRHRSGQWAIVLDRPWMLWATVIGPYLVLFGIGLPLVLLVEAIR